MPNANTPWHLKAVLSAKKPKVQIAKSLNEPLMQVTWVVMQPGTDLHGDYTDVEEIRKAKESFNKSNKTANLFHMFKTDSFEVIESYQTFTDIYLDDNFVEKGSWLCTLQVLNKDVWAMIESGEINGVSIGAKASVETIEDEDE